MTVSRQTFLSHFVLCLAIAAGAFFAYQAGVPQLIWADDLSKMTSVIAVLFVVTAVYLGRQAWRADNDLAPSFPAEHYTSFGHLSALLCPALGMLGTVVGLSLQAKALVSGAASFGALATSLYTTGVGIGAFVLVSILVFNLEHGISRRAQR